MDVKSFITLGPGLEPPILGWYGECSTTVSFYQISLNYKLPQTNLAIQILLRTNNLVL